MKKIQIPHLSDIRSAHELNGVRRAILSGRAIHVTMKREDAPSGFVLVGARDCGGSILAPLVGGSAGPRLFVFVDPLTLDLPRTRFGMSADGYLRWGLRKAKSGTTILFGGGEGGDGITLQVLVFQGGRLVEVREKALPSRSSSMFDGALFSMLEQWRVDYPTARFVQAAPLSPWDVDGVEFIGEEGLQGISFHRVVAKRDGGPSLAAPALLLCFGLLGCAGVVYASWASYDNAKGRFDAVMNDPVVKAAGGVDTASLDRSNARRSYMEQPRRQVALVAVAETVAKAVATVPGARIVHLAVPASPLLNGGGSVGLSVDPADRDASNSLTADREPDFAARIAVLRAPGTGLGQAQEVLSRLASATGMSLRLAHQGTREDGDRRVFVVEGFIHKGELKGEGEAK